MLWYFNRDQQPRDLHERFSIFYFSPAFVHSLEIDDDDDGNWPREETKATSVILHDQGDS